MLTITNTLLGKKEPLTLQKEILLYVCGITTYDRCHLGHARSAIVFDVIRNYLEYKGGNVRFVKNFTDLDDKIIHRALREGCDYQEIAERYITAYKDDMNRLRVRPPTLAPRATEHIPEMIGIISDLLAKEIAYTISGNVYFDVARFPAYGRLSGQNLDQLTASGRIEPDPDKKNPSDFALWKVAKPLEPSWDTPWGKGRPGWHIECSAMILKQLGATIDLHGGGTDLVFPHHENEIAQSEAHTGKPLVRCWMHHGQVTLNHEKMSKSLGNFFTIQEIFEKSSRFSEKIVTEVIRYFLLSTHYRSPVDFSDKELTLAKVGLDRFYSLFQKLDDMAHADPRHEEHPHLNFFNRFRQDFDEAMDDDFNTPKAIGVLHALRASINTRLIPTRTPKDAAQQKQSALEALHLFKAIGNLFGLFQVPPGEWSYQPWESSFVPLDEGEISNLVAEREAARKARDWSRADTVRIQLQERGVILEDQPDGTTRIKR